MEVGDLCEFVGTTFDSHAYLYKELGDGYSEVFKRVDGYNHTLRTGDQFLILENKYNVQGKYSCIPHIARILLNRDMISGWIIVKNEPHTKAIVKVA